MGYQTEYIGHIGIDPPLNEAEQLYLTAFVDSVRFARPGGPYEVPYNPRADPDLVVKDSIITVSSIAEGQPSSHCGWAFCFDGDCITYDGSDKFNNPTPWLVYLIDHFLRPGAHASRTGLHWFERFTFDHQLSGVVAASRSDTGRLYLIRVSNNEVEEETVVPGHSEWYLGA